MRRLKPVMVTRHIADSLAVRRGEAWFHNISLSVVVVVISFILSRLLYLAFSANLGLLCMPHSGMGPIV